MVRLFCQFVLVGMLICSFLRNVYTDFNGREAKEGGDFTDFICTLLATIFITGLFYYAGALDEIIGWVKS